MMALLGDINMDIKITNKHRWPESIVKCITKDRYNDPNDLPSDFSATTLIQPVQKVILEKRYKENLKVQDVSDMMWAFLGSLAHEVLEQAWKDEEGSKVEERLYAEILGKIVSGKIDCYANKEIRDYKTCKAYKIIKGNYLDWEIQLNIYQYLCEKAKYPVDSLCIYAIIFDWKEHESYKPGYPSSQIVKIPIRKWTLIEVEDYLQKRVMLFDTAAMLDDEQLAKQYPCSDHERWADVKDWSIIKHGASRATKVFDNEADAYTHLKRMNSDYTVVKRMTPPTRCLKYCLAAPHCQQHKTYLKERGEDGELEPERCIF